MAQSISWRGAGHVWRRNVVLYKRTWLINLLPNFFEPVVYLVGLGLGVGSYIGTQMGGMSYLAFIAPGLVVSNAMNGATFETTYNVFIRMNFNRTYDAIVATPINIEDAMLGDVLWAITRGFIYGFVFALVTVPFGLLDAASLLGLIPVILLGSWLFAAIGLLFTAYIKVIDLFSFYYTLFLTPLFLFSGIFFPLDRIGAWAPKAAWFTPLYHVVNLANAVVHGTWQVGRLWDFVWIAVVAAGCTVWAIARIKRRLVP